MIDGHVRDWELHFERLRLGAEYLYGPFTDDHGHSLKLKDRLESAIHHEAGNKVIRLTIYGHQARGLRGMRNFSIGDLKIHLSASLFEPNRVEGALRLRTCAATMRPNWWPSYLKAGSYLDVILAQRHHLRERDDDLLFLSPDDTLLESSVANVFVVRHNRLYTAPLGPNVLDGIMRRKVLDLGPMIFDEVIEEASSMEQARKADAVFGTNSVRGPFLISSIDDYQLPTDKDFMEKFGLLRAQAIK
jgi:branched-subunit amino acid aminotransferase/4-amino-4-deoxychorismate lyase